MTTTVTLGVFLFLLILYGFYKATFQKSKEEYGEAQWHRWGAKVYYWQFAILLSGGITVGIIFLLSLANVVTI